MIDAAFGNADYPFVGVDVGNSRLKLARFDAASDDPLPMPAAVLELSLDRDSLDRISEWLAPMTPRDVAWRIASVDRRTTARMIDWLREADAPRISLVTSQDLDLRIELPPPLTVGIDRLLNAVAINRVRTAGRAAIVVDFGTAVKVDLVDSTGAFRGGAIMPGIGISARALHQFTDMLPLIDIETLAEPPALGTNTVAAMSSGIFWGAVGGANELIRRMSEECAGAADVFVTGGAAENVAALLKPAATHLPHLTIAGIALAAAKP